MKTIAKYSLNPLARCFVPLSMKAYAESYDTYSIVNNDTTPLFKKTYEGFSAVKNKLNTASQFPGITKEAKELLTKAIGTEESLVTTKGALPTDHEMPRETAVESTPETINGYKISVEPKEKTGIQDMSLLESDTFLLKKPRRKISKIFRTGARIQLLFPIPSILDVDELSYVTVTKNDIIVYLRMMLYSFCLAPQSKWNELPYASNIEEVEEDIEDCEECHCPSMFGWIIPLNFFGNPLKLRNTCSKKFGHISYKSESKIAHNEPIHTTISGNGLELDDKTTLEQCSSELQAIVKDVCDSVDQTLAMTNDENSGCVSQTKVFQTGLNRPVWETATEKDSDLEIIDDGVHPLLKEGYLEDNDDKELLETQQLLTRAMSPDSETSNQSTCVLPCTVWCNNVPPPARDAYRRFIKKFHPENTNQKTDNVNDKALRKILYKRSFSADDTPIHFNIGKKTLLSSSSFETRERLLLLRKDPVAYIKQSNRVASEEIRRFRLDVSKDCLNSSPYYGADSLWQPLPECVPVGDQIQKHSLRRIRDIRRQNSVC